MGSRLRRVGLGLALVVLMAGVVTPSGRYVVGGRRTGLMLSAPRAVERVFCGPVGAGRSPEFSASLEQGDPRRSAAAGCSQPRAPFGTRIRQRAPASPLGPLSGPLRAGRDGGAQAPVLPAEGEAPRATGLREVLGRGETLVFTGL